jgi:sec-independent protein translocase protein TatC
VIGWFLYPQLITFLLHPYNDIQSLTDGKLLATGPTDGFAIRLKLTMYVAIAFAMPVLLWQIWRFISPGLYKHERKYALPFVISAIVLFLMGAAIAYWTLPKALDWLSTIGGSEITQAYTADKYFQLIAYMMLAFGICFEFPILLVFIQMAGIVSNKQLRGVWRQTVVGITVIVAVATPSNDPISMLALTVPLVVFFFGAVGIGWVIERRKARKAAKAPH